MQQNYLSAGIMIENERAVLESMSCEKTNLYFVPLVWAGNLVNRARKEGRIKDDFSVKTLIDVRNGYFLLNRIWQITSRCYVC